MPIYILKYSTRLYGPVVEKGILRIRTDREMRELNEDLDVVTDIKRKRSEWIGHIARMDQVRTIKKIFERKLVGSTRRGRPRLRWLEDAEKGLREMKTKRRRLKAVDEEEWASVIKEAKALRGP
jgi:hypothetical protein